LQNDSDAIAPYLTCASLCGGIKTKYLHVSVITVAKSFKDFNGRCLTGAIRAKEGEDFALLNCEVQAIYSVG
jgi:hypothetical protein